MIDFLSTVDKDFRVGELIEHVKRDFLSNHLQAPQGSALNCKGHMGGEMIVHIHQTNDRRDLKGYSNFLQVLKLYKMKSDFKEIDTFEDKTQRIGFQLYHEVDNVLRKSAYYLYLYEGTLQARTLRYLQTHHNEIFKNKNLIIFIPKEKFQATSQTRVNNIISKFKPINAFTIDRFIRDQCTPEIEFDRSNFLSISNFILPSLGNHLHVKEYIANWFLEVERPILVIKGSGGIGKTTCAQFIADEWLKKSPKAYVVFIDSVQIKDALMKVTRFTEKLELYHFYEAFNEISGSGSSRLSEEVFRMNIDAGNILLIVDGLDEVIAKVPSFKVKVFLDSIRDASKGLGSGKVVLTCRTHFWDISEVSDLDLKVVELEPFSLEQAKLFFEKSMLSNSKIKRAIDLANEFKYPGSDGEKAYHPYMLDVIRSIIVADKDAITVDLTQFSSKILRSDVKNDYVLYRVCDRERKRVGQISVDSQVKLFTYLAAYKRGTVAIDQFKPFAEDTLGRPIDLASVAAFKAHPFLKASESNVSFKYDFLSDLFKSVYLAQYFDFENESAPLSTTLAELLEENCWYGSAINHDIIFRIQHWTEIDILLIAELISRIWIWEEIKFEKRRKIVSTLFAVSLSINQRFHGNNVVENTRLLKGLFGTQNDTIRNWSVSNIRSEHSVKFDFSGIKFFDCHISEYSSFWQCQV